MLVDSNCIADSPFGPCDADLSEYLNTDLFLNVPSPSSSRASSPQSPFQSLLTPPQSTAQNSFPEVYESPPASSSNLFMLNEELKLDEPPLASPASYDFFGTFASGSSTINETAMTIDPQLVGTLSSHDSPGVTEDEDVVEQSCHEKLTLTIAPIKVGGYGKARKGTVQNGGVVKRTAAPPTPPPAPAPVVAAPSPHRDKDMDDDDLPADWRPPPEVFAKMSSKEKRQLRNKISARNFRVRRKEYISTLELDIAERDRLLQAIRSELGSTQSENQALRQEIAALKLALLEGRPASELTADDIPMLNLPPPGPLPRPATAAAATHATSPAPTLLTPNTQKDVASSSNAGRFWGGVPMGGGITPVHTVLMPDFSFTKGAISPALNAERHVKTPAFDKLSGFDSFADGNPFTMKSSDSYRTYLWSNMASQQTQCPPSPPSSTPSSPSPLAKLTSFSGSPSGNWSSFPSSMGPRFFRSSVLSGKQSPSPPSSPIFRAHSPMPQSQKDDPYMLIGALACHTLLQRLGGLFWDAFTGSPLTSGMDVDTVLRLLEGKAVLHITDVDERKEMGTLKRKSSVPSELPKETCAMTALLEENMKSLTLGKK